MNRYRLHIFRPKHKWSIESEQVYQWRLHLDVYITILQPLLYERSWFVTWHGTKNIMPRFLKEKVIIEHFNLVDGLPW
jgi:hypothetical protein